MIYVSNLLLDAARALGKANPELGDADLHFPSLVQPIVQLEEPYDTASNPDVNVPQQQSWSNTGFNSVLGGAGGVSATIGRLGPGLWDIDVTLSLSTNFTRAAGVFFPVNITLAVPTGGNIVVLAGAYEAGVVGTQTVAQTIQKVTRILLAVPSSQITYNAANNAATQNTLFSFSVLCRKLL